MSIEKRFGDGRHAKYPDEFRVPRSQDELRAGYEERARIRDERGLEPEWYASDVAAQLAAAATVEIGTIDEPADLTVEQLDIEQRVAS